MPDRDFDASSLLIAIDLVEQAGMPEQAEQLRALVRAQAGREKAFVRARARKQEAERDFPAPWKPINLKQLSRLDTEARGSCPFCFGADGRPTFPTDEFIPAELAASYRFVAMQRCRIRTRLPHCPEVYVGQCQKCGTWYLG